MGIRPSRFDENLPFYDYKAAEKKGNVLPFLFVSYCHANKDDIRQYVEEFIHMGYRIWTDGGIRTGNDWEEDIEDAIRKSAGFISFFSNEYFMDKHYFCSWELEKAFDHFQEEKRNRIFTICLSNTEIPKKYISRCGQYQTSGNLTDDSQKNKEYLRSEISSKFDNCRRFEPLPKEIQNRYKNDISKSLGEKEPYFILEATYTEDEFQVDDQTGPYDLLNTILCWGEDKNCFNEEERSRICGEISDKQIVIICGIPKSGKTKLGKTIFRRVYEQAQKDPPYYFQHVFYKEIKVKRDGKSTRELLSYKKFSLVDREAAGNTLIYLDGLDKICPSTENAEEYLVREIENIRAYLNDLPSGEKNTKVVVTSSKTINRNLPRFDIALLGIGILKDEFEEDNYDDIPHFVDVIEDYLQISDDEKNKLRDWCRNDKSIKSLFQRPSTFKIIHKMFHPQKDGTKISYADKDSFLTALYTYVDRSAKNTKRDRDIDIGLPDYEDLAWYMESEKGLPEALKNKICDMSYVEKDNYTGKYRFIIPEIQHHFLARYLGRLLNDYYNENESKKCIEHFLSEIKILSRKKARYGEILNLNEETLSMLGKYLQSTLCKDNSSTLKRLYEDIFDLFQKEYPTLYGPIMGDQTDYYAEDAIMTVKRMVRSLLISCQTDISAKVAENLTGTRGINFQDFSRMRLQGIDLMTIKALNFSDAEIDRIYLSDTSQSVEYSDFSGCRIKEADFLDAKMSYVSFNSAVGAVALIEKLDFRRSEIKFCDFSGCRIKEADFLDAQMSYVSFNSAVALFEKLDFRRSEIKFCDFSGCRIKEADFLVAKMSYVSFNSAVLGQYKENETDEEEKTVSQKKASGLAFSVNIDRNKQPEKPYFFKATRFEHVTFIDAKIGKNVTFKDAVLKDVDFSGAKFKDFPGCGITGELSDLRRMHIAEEYISLIDTGRNSC